MTDKKKQEKKQEKKIGPPSRLHTIFEGVTAYRDLCLSATAWPFKKMALPQGDGHPVLLLPGFLAHDVSMEPMRHFLNEMNYKAEAWQGGVNWGPTEERLDHIKKRLKKIYDDNDGQKVSLIGWSLGGLYARELAREFPEMVRDVISLGSPFQATNNPDSTVVGSVFKHINPDIDPEVDFDFNLPITPPMTSIYTKKDGVVHWQTCLLKQDKKTENIEVNSSHMGLIVNPQVLTILADRLAQPEGQWKKFIPSKHPFARIKHPDKQAHNRLNTHTQKTARKKAPNGKRP